MSTALAVNSHFNRHQEGITVNWGMDKTRSKGWTAVVVRNLPPGCSTGTVMRNFTKNGEKIKAIMEIKKVKGHYCTIVVTESLKDAEEICLRHNGEKLNPVNKLKVHMHPNSCLFRQDNTLLHTEFFTNINQSMELITESIKKSGSETPITKTKDEKKATKLPTELKQTLMLYFDEADKKAEINRENTQNSIDKLKEQTVQRPETSPHKGNPNKDLLNQDTKSTHIQDMNSPHSRQPRKHSREGRSYDKYSYKPSTSDSTKEYRPAEQEVNNGRSEFERRKESSMDDKEKDCYRAQQMQGLEEGEILFEDEQLHNSRKRSRDNSYEVRYSPRKRERHDHYNKRYHDDHYNYKSYSRNDSRDESRYGERRTRNYYPSNYEREYSR